MIDWIKSHSKPAAREKTLITFTDGTQQEYDWSGEINKQTMIDAGLRDSNSFSWIKNPQTVEIGTNVTSIGDSAFTDCNNLTSVIIPDGVTSIEVGAFSNGGLTSMTIPDSVTSIGDLAFYNNSLTSVTIGNNVTSIGEQAFYMCTGLTSVVFKGKTLAQVQAMENYSWGIDKNIITVA